MKASKTITGLALASALLTVPILAWAADHEEHAHQAAKPKPYTLETCVVSGEKLGELGKPYVFTHEGREIKLCCNGCLKDFKKDPAKYIKKIEQAEKGGKESQPSAPAHEHGGHQH